MARFYFSLAVLGCRANQAEVDVIRSLLFSVGGEEASYPGPADLVVVNTCAVTTSAQAQSRQEIRKVSRSAGDSMVIVTGCGAQLAPQEFASLEGVDLVLGNKAKAILPELLNQLLTESASPGSGEISRENLLQALRDSSLSKAVTGDVSVEAKQTEKAGLICWDSDPSPDRFVGRTRSQKQHRQRPVVKIQDGCSYKCAYCIVSRLRGQPQSRDPEDTIREVTMLAESGIREIVLAGINLGLYGTESGTGPLSPLVGLLERLESIPGLERVRLSSLEPMTIQDDLLDYIAGSPLIARHFHLSFQSGDDGVLRRMKRPYNADWLKALVGRISERIDRFGLGVDIVVGYPGESEAAFAGTLSFLEQMPVTYIHPFVYSERPGTEGANSGEVVPNGERKQRSARLRELDARLRQRFAAMLTGQRCSILVDKADGDSYSGISGEYVRLTGRGSGVAPGDLIDVIPMGSFEGNSIRCSLTSRGKAD